MKNKIVILLIAIFTFLGTISAKAEGPANGIRTAIEKIRDICIAKMDKIPDEELDSELSKIIHPLFDFEDMSKRSLGQNWNKATVEEQREFVELFSGLLARTYLKRIKRNAKSSKIDKITETIEDNKAFVRSTVDVDEEDTSIDYRLSLQGTEWKIYDVVIENVGLVSNYRNEFGGIVRKDGMQGLIAQLKTKRDEQAKAK